MGQFVLKLRDLEEGLSHHTFELPDEWLRSQMSDVEGIGGGAEGGRVELDVTRSGREFLLRGELWAPLVVTCVRCLEDFALSVEAFFEVLMLPGAGKSPRAASKDDEESSEELGVELYKGEEIVLDDLIRDTILLEVPMNPNCGEQCPGWDHLRQEGGAKSS